MIATHVATREGVVLAAAKRARSDGPAPPWLGSALPSAMPSAMPPRVAPSAEAQRTVMRELARLRRACATAAADGIESVSVDEADAFKWTVELSMPEGTRLAEDLRAYAAAATARRRRALGGWGDGSSSMELSREQAADAEEAETKAVVTLELTLPPDYPSRPPFVRVVSPRFAFHTGHVTIGGSLCMELLTSAGWRSSFTLESTLVQVRQALLEGGGALDPRYAHRPYAAEEARRAFWRVARQHGWEA